MQRLTGGVVAGTGATGFGDHFVRAPKHELHLSQDIGRFWLQEDVAIAKVIL